MKNQCDGCQRRLPLRSSLTAVDSLIHSNPDGSYDHICCTANRYGCKPFQMEADPAALALEALREFYDLRDLGDFIYEIREREGLGWEGPLVRRWGEACEKAKKALGL
jgi:hypothetical protein